MFVTDVLTEIYIALVVLVCVTAGVFLSRLIKPKKQERPGTVSLSSRETQILQLIAEGLSNAEIADKLFLSLSTVKREVSALFLKLDVKNRVQAQEKANRLKIN